MILLFLFLAQAQDSGVEALIAQLDHDDSSLREKAQSELIQRGRNVVPRLLSHHRTTDSAESRGRTESILSRFPFETLAQTRTGESLRERMKEMLLQDLEPHRGTPGCWLPKENQLAIDPAHLTILWQTGSGHGQFLAIVRIASGDKGCLEIRRIVWQGITPYRSEVKAEGVKVEESRFDADESKALGELLQAGIVLQAKCARPRESGRSWMSSGSFSMRFRIESGGVAVWSAAYTGYPGSSGEPDYAHGRVIDNVLGKILRNRSWTEVNVLPEDRARALQWMTDHFATEAWWIREHYLNMARTIGDETYRPFLEKVSKDLEGKEDPSEQRQLQAVRVALSRLRPAGK